MFSEKFYLKDTQTVYRVTLDGKNPDLQKKSFSQRDILLVTPEYYKRSKEMNHAVFQGMKSISQLVKSENFLKSGLYNNNISDSEYFQWYKVTSNSILNTQNENIEVFTQKYIWDADSLKPVSPPAKITYFGSN